MTIGGFASQPITENRSLIYPFTLASATRFPGILLIVPVALLYLYGPRGDRKREISDGFWPRYYIRRDAAWLLLGPLGLVAFSVYLHFAVGNAFAWNDAQVVFSRHTVDPVRGTWAGLKEAGWGIEAGLVGLPATRGDVEPGQAIVAVRFKEVWRR